jgi:Family of unknown function (DUF5832)
MTDTNQNTDQIQQNTTDSVGEPHPEVVVAETTPLETNETQVDTVTESGKPDVAQTDVETNNQDNDQNDPSDQNDKPTFGADDESEESEDDGEPDLSKYTVLDADNLDEDDPIPGQEYALFSFMSPEGIMNCNIRAFKFRGAFPSIEKATEHAETLKKKDKYFKIHCGESGKWVEFDPPEEHVEKVVAGNKKQQKIIDAQRKARMDKINELAGRHKQKTDKSDRGAESRIEESKKAGAAEDYSNKNRSKTQKKKKAKQAKQQRQVAAGSSGRAAKHEAMRERMRKKIEARKSKEANKNRLNNTRGDNAERTVTTEERFESGQVSNEELKKKTEDVNQASNDLEAKKSELQRTNANIDKIRKMMQNK